MQQLDLETQELGRGIAGENLRGAAAAAAAEEDREADPFHPAEGVELRIGEGIGWEDFMAVYDRDDSTKGTTNPKSHQDLRPSTATTTSSQRFSGSLNPAATAAAPILMLPSQMQSTAYLNYSRSGRRSSATARIFPKKAPRGGGDGGVGKSRDPAPEYEPSSPKVSCIGKVLSDRERGRRPKNAAGRNHGGDDGSRFCSWLTIALCCGGGGEDRDPADRSTSEGRTIPGVSPEAKRKAVADLRSADPAPGLGTMKRFASGRKPDSWGGGGGGGGGFSGDADSGHVDRSRASDEYSVAAGG